MAFKKAERTQLWLRLAIFGPPGSGKTMSALRIAKGIADKIDGRIAVIDTEARSASKYADRIPFEVDDLEKKNIGNYIRSMREAAEGGYKVLVIDSLSHAWQELLDEVDRIAKASASKNSWAAWSEGTPKQRSLVNAVLNFPGHLIVTMRSKIEWELVEEKGKKVPKKLGLAPEQGKGIEYEFDMLVEINQEHYATVTKDRTGKYQDEILSKPDEKFGAGLFDWLNKGTAPPPAAKTMEQMETEYLAVKTELKNILQSRGPGGSALFTGAEYNAAAAVFAGLKGKPVQEYLAAAEALLAEKKSQMRDRYGALTAPAVPAPGPAAPPPPLPEMYSQAEDDGFEDDMPESFTGTGEEDPAEAEAELDIF